MTDNTIFLMGMALALAGPILFVVLARIVRRSQFSYLALSSLVVVCVGSLMFSTAFLTKTLLNIVGRPIISFTMIAVVQIILMAIAVRLVGQGTAQSVAAGSG